MATNEILLFAHDPAANVLTQAEYLAEAQRTIGHQPGIAKAELENKALRQASLMSAGLAQFLADLQATNIVDTLTPAQLSTITQAALQAMINSSLASHGQCVLSKSGANLLLSPKNGNRLKVNGVSCSIPAVGVTLAPPATTNTTYYIYATAAAGVITALEASATAHSADTTVGANQGVEVKTGDVTRTLVGMARTVASAWVDTAAQRFVRSWFNDQGVGGEAFMSAVAPNTTSTAWIELANDMRNEFLSWLGEKVTAASTGECGNNTANQTMSSSIAYNGIVPEDVLARGQCAVANLDVGPLTVVHTKTGLAEGYNYAALVVKVSGGIGTWYGGASSAERLTLNTRVGT